MPNKEFAKLIEESKEWVRLSKSRGYDFNSILAGLYNDPSHFIYEILQNAEDENAKKVVFKLFEDRLDIYHDGELFDFDDIKGVTGIEIPTKKGDWKTRKFYTIDIIQQESYDVAQRFIDLLSKAKVQTGKALHHAESIYKGKLKKKAIEETLPEAWNKLISEPHSLLLDLLSETTEKLCGFKPEVEGVTRFLKHYEGKFLLPPEENTPKEPKKIPRPPSKRISQADLIPHIIKVLQKHGGRAQKPQVEEEIYQMFKDTFKKPYYQETVSHGVPRWRHNIAWAKERAKKRGLIKPPKDSGRGYWELTPSGMKMTLKGGATNCV
ncbi:MAG: winged helix-turn-helix domain-containing protein [Candidatus Brocadiales bacterium]